MFQYILQGSNIKSSKNKKRNYKAHPLLWALEIIIL